MEELLELAGVTKPDAPHLLSGTNAERALAIANRLLATPPSLQRFGPRATALSVLSQLAMREHSATGDEIRDLIRAHAGLTIVRPDGYLVSATSGAPIQRIGDVVLDEDRMIAGELEVGRFYRNDQGCLYEVDADLKADRTRGIVLELGLEHNLPNKILDGAEDALIGIAMTVGHTIEDPIRAIEDLLDLPIELVELIVHSPELCERFWAMPAGDQARAVGQLTIDLLTLRAAGSSAVSAARSSSAKLGTNALQISAGQAALQLQIQLSLADLAAGAVTVGGSLALVSGYSTQLAELVELSDTTKAGLKRASRVLSEDGARLAKTELPKIPVERNRVIELIDALLADGRLSQRSHSRLRQVRNALQDHLQPEDLIGALRDALGIPVRRSGDGHTWRHIDEVQDALQSLDRASAALAEDLVQLHRSGDAITGLSEDIDAIKALVRRVRRFLEIR